MGIDAAMFFATDKEINQDDLLTLAIDLYDAFGGNVVFPLRGWSTPESGTLDEVLALGDHARHCITAISAYEQDGPTVYPGEGEFFYKVHLWGRYYGPDYERGNLSSILSVSRWLGLRVPHCRVYYGGDSSGVCAKELTLQYEAELWAHFVEHGHEPYFSHWATGDKLDKQPTCQLCQIPMRRFGAGGTYAAYSCRGCGFRIKTNDSGKIWSIYKDA